MPKELDGEYDDVLAEILNILVDDITLNTYKDPNVSEEFKIDSWWKTRGLQLMKSKVVLMTGPKIAIVKDKSPAYYLAVLGSELCQS